MSSTPDETPKLTTPSYPPELVAYQLQELSKRVDELRKTTADGFEKFEKLLDTRLQSRDTRMDELELRLRAVERRQNEREGQNKITFIMLSAGLTAAIGMLVTLMFRSYSGN